MMKVIKDLAHRLQFDFSLESGDRELLNHCALIELTALRFRGKVKVQDTYLNGVEERRALVMVQLKNLEICGDALAHCRTQLEPDGRVRRRYLGALEAADPGLGRAKALRRRLQKLARD